LAPTLQLEQLKEIVETSLWHPSGDNCQPWSFSWVKQQLRIHHNSNRGTHPLNAGNIASALSLGCLIEAVSISASQYGFQAKAQYHGFSNGPESCWATVSFEFVERQTDPLVKFIRQRTTDRRLFEKGELPVTAIEECVKLGEDLAPAKLHCLTGLTPELTDYIVNAEKLMMDHSQIVPKVLEWTRFSQAELLRLQDGLSLKNMGVRFWEVPSLRLLKAYPSVFPYMKPMMIPQHMARVRKQLNSAAGVICTSIPRDQASKAPAAGRTMYRAWLELTRLGFGAQPLTIASTLVFYAQNGLLDASFSQEWIQFFKEGEAVLRKAFKFPEDHLPIWMIRAGKSSPLPDDQRTLRRSVESLLRTDN
jgi:nitroreductase